MEDVKEVLRKRRNLENEMNRLKVETAEELGYEHVDSDFKYTGKVAGTMVKKMVEMAERQFVQSNQDRPKNDE